PLPCSLRLAGEGALLASQLTAAWVGGGCAVRPALLSDSPATDLSPTLSLARLGSQERERFLLRNSQPHALDAGARCCLLSFPTSLPGASPRSSRLLA